MEYQKVTPIFNYIGGKSWMKNRLREKVALVLSAKEGISTYQEPFSGALGAFLGVYDILIENNVKTVKLNDINQHLIQLYSNLNENKDSLIKELLSIENEFLETIPEEVYSLHKTKDKQRLKELLQDANQFYKDKRDIFNQYTIEGKSHSALLIFLQTHCFNGVYRENSKGLYNTPFNWEAKKSNLEKMKDKLDNIARVFSCFNMEFTQKSYTELDYNSETLYYLDPPYLNEDSMIENKYNKDVFGVEDQENLIDLVENYSFIYSNHDNEAIRHILQQRQVFDIESIPRKNIISSNNESRKTDKLEVLATKI